MKERLLGAAVLVAIGVWLIPWVLDGPENALDSSPSSLQLPAAEEPMPMRTQSLRLGEPDATAAADAGDAPAAAQEQTPEPAATVVAAPDTRAASTAEEPAARPADTDTEHETAAPPPAAATAAPAPRTAAPPAAAGDWIVQLGSFSEEANARRLAQRASTYGYQADVASVRSNGRTLYRVRVGPATTRAQADAKASALRAHGIEARVVDAN